MVRLLIVLQKRPQNIDMSHISQASFFTDLVEQSSSMNIFTSRKWWSWIWRIPITHLTDLLGLLTEEIGLRPLEPHYNSKKEVHKTTSRLRANSGGGPVSTLATLSFFSSTSLNFPTFHSFAGIVLKPIKTHNGPKDKMTHKLLY